MKKLFSLIAVLCLISFTVPAHATFNWGGGEGNNTGCNGRGNRNSPCEGTTNNGGNGGNVTVRDSGNSSSRSSVRNSGNSTNKIKVNNSVRNNVDASSRNKNVNRNSNKQGQSQSANNEGINIGGNTYEDNSVYLAPPPTTPLVGTVSAQVTTPFGGAGYSKDAKHAKIMVVIEFVGKLKDSGVISEEQAIEDSQKLYKKLLKTVCRSCARSSDKEVDGNSGNL